MKFNYLRYLKIAFFLLILPYTSLFAAQAYPDPSPQELRSFWRLVDDEIEKADQLLSELYQEMYGNPFPQAIRARIKHAEDMLETKLILASKFRQSSLIVSPVVRDALLEILRLEDITGSDILRFQDIVEQERKYIQSFEEMEDEEMDKQIEDQEPMDEDTKVEPMAPIRL